MKRFIISTAIVTMFLTSTAFGADNAKLNQDIYARAIPSITSKEVNLYKEDKLVEITQINNSWVKVKEGEWIPVVAVDWTSETEKKKFVKEIKSTYKVLGSAVLNIEVNDTSEVAKKLHNMEVALFRATKSNIKKKSSWSFKNSVGNINAKAGFYELKNKTFGGSMDGQDIIRQALEGTGGISFITPEPDGLEIKSTLTKDILLDVKVDYKYKAVKVTAYEVK